MSIAEDKISVLIADDSEDNRLLLVHMLRRFGITPDLVSNGQEAVDATLSTNYDLIFLDIQMPVMCGLEAAEKIRANGFTNPLVALTAHAMVTFEKKCFDAGFSNVVTRPFRLDDIEKVVTDMV